jgi:hypothetical protein
MQPLVLEADAGPDCGSSGICVDHGDAMGSVGSHRRCPRCNAATRQHIAHFIGATTLRRAAQYLVIRTDTARLAAADIRRTGRSGRFRI